MYMCVCVCTCMSVCLYKSLSYEINLDDNRIVICLPYTFPYIFEY